MKAFELYFCGYYFLPKKLTLEPVDKNLANTMKATEQHFTVVLFITLYNVLPSFEGL